MRTGNEEGMAAPSLYSPISAHHESCNIYEVRLSGQWEFCILVRAGFSHRRAED